jgi:hypothetical protein
MVAATCRQNRFMSWCSASASSWFVSRRDVTSAHYPAPFDIAGITDECLSMHNLILLHQALVHQEEYQFADSREGADRI